MQVVSEAVADWRCWVADGDRMNRVPFEGPEPECDFRKAIQRALRHWIEEDPKQALRVLREPGALRPCPQTIAMMRSKFMCDPASAIFAAG